MAPFLIATFIALIGISSVVRHRAILGAAAASGVRVASAYGASDTQGRVAANNILATHGLSRSKVGVTITHPFSNGVRLVQVVVHENVRVPWINREVSLSQSSRAVDEESLL
jgi:hypothetical protein